MDDLDRRLDEALNSGITVPGVLTSIVVAAAIVAGVLWLVA